MREGALSMDLPTPVLLASFGRSGSSFLLEAFKFIDSVFVPSNHPYERRFINYNLHLVNTCFISEYKADSSLPTISDYFNTEVRRVGPCPHLDSEILDPRWINRVDFAKKLFSRIMEVTISEIFPEAMGKKYWIEKGFEQEHLLTKLNINHRRIIYLIRDPRDLFLSMVRFGNLSIGDLNNFITEYSAFLGEVKKWGRVDPRNMVIRYEDAVISTHDTIKQVAKFLDQSNFKSEDFCSAEIKSHQTSDNALSSIGKWKLANDEEVLLLVHKIQNEMVELIEYFGWDAGIKLRSNKFLISDNKAAIVGGNGNIFINDGSNHVTDSLSRSAVDDQYLYRHWYSAIRALRETVDQTAIKSLFIISPEKNSVYHEELPDGTVINPNRLSIKLQEDFVGFVFYPFHLLTELKSLRPCYHQNDSHWNYHGGYEVYASLLRSLMDENAKPVIKYSLRPHTPDLLAHYLPSKPTILEQFVDLEGVSEELISYIEGRQRGHFIKSTNRGAFYSECVFIAGDSYSWNKDAGLFRFFAQQFETVYFYWTPSIKEAMEKLNHIKADIFIFQIAERFMYYPDDFNG